MLRQGIPDVYLHMYCQNWTPVSAILSDQYLGKIVFLHKFDECFKGQWSWCIRDQELHKESLCIILWLQKHSLPMAQTILQMKASVHADSQVFLMLALAGTVSVLVLSENSHIEMCFESCSCNYS